MTKQIAKLHYLRIAPRKVRALAHLLQGLPVEDAEAELLHQRRRAARPLLKLLRSAVAGAKHAKQLNAESLYIERIAVDQGPMIKRFLPRARGMATPIQKKMSHVTLTLAENPALTPHFKIVVPKKVKLPPEERAKAKKEKEKEIAKESVHARPKSPGFFQKMFRRKAV